MPKIARLTDAEREKADELRRTFGVGAMTQAQAQIGEELGIKETATHDWVRDVPHITVNGRPKYQVSDVAQKIVANRVEP